VLWNKLATARVLTGVSGWIEFRNFTVAADDTKCACILLYLSNRNLLSRYITCMYPNAFPHLCDYFNAPHTPTVFDDGDCDKKVISDDEDYNYDTALNLSSLRK
jgi:hypothetical protein